MRTDRRLRPWVMVVAAAALIGAVAAILLSGSIASKRAYQSSRVEGRASAALHAALLRSELQKFRLIPLALADDPQTRQVLDSPDREAVVTFDRRLERLNDRIHSAALYLLDSQGTTIAASNWNQPLSFVGSNYGFRSYFQDALASGNGEQFALGTVSRLPGLYIARRVETGRSTGVVVLKVEFDQLENEWRQSGSPAFVTDSRGVVLITSRPGWRFLTNRFIDSEERAQLRKSLDFGQAPLTPLPIARTNRPGIVTIAGSRDEAANEYVETLLPTTTPGWTLHLLTPVTGVKQAAYSARIVTAVILLLAALLVGMFVRRRMRRAQAAARAEANRAQLEAEVEARTLDLRQANRKLKQEMHDRRASEAKLEQARDQLVQANKLASLGQITAGVAHEINQPVAAIRSYADNGRILIEKARNADAADNLSRIVAMTERIDAIISELRGFARKARGTLGPLRIGDAIDGATLLLRDRIERRGVAVTVAGDMDAMVIGERVRLEQVLVNLIVNALDAMQDAADPRITLTVAARGKRVDVDIADNGPGLTEEAAASLFQPFQTSKEQGLGLGLTLSRDIMRDLGGDLSRVAVADGACFRMTLKSA
ncbi:sensor histidine kinase [Sphingosinithalassobacter portus]|uniref:sensor histidine kinase n=1 Tax=Stakelama portus TaxID=2676234 RepID=UPI000D6DEE1E|nr:ATP-binding protein [Sphingosinithalassobacter portus]